MLGKTDQNYLTVGVPGRKFFSNAGEVFNPDRCLMHKDLESVMFRKCNGDSTK